MKSTIHLPDVAVWASLKGCAAKLVLAASQERLPIVVVKGEEFRSLGEVKEALFVCFVCSPGIFVLVFVLIREQCRIKAQPRCHIARRSMSLL
jgi:hypothetical protein